jgi:hypothetical protein
VGVDSANGCGVAVGVASATVLDSAAGVDSTNGCELAVGATSANVEAGAGVDLASGVDSPTGAGLAARIDSTISTDGFVSADASGGTEGFASAGMESDDVGNGVAVVLASVTANSSFSVGLELMAGATGPARSAASEVLFWTDFVSPLSSVIEFALSAVA